MTDSKNNGKKWEILANVKGQKSPASPSEAGRAKVKSEDIVDILLKNRGIKSKREKDEFFNPTLPDKMSVKSLGLSAREISKAINRIKKAKEKKEKVIVFGDYDADGVCATAILWENLYGLKLDVLPYIPERFSEGYGLKTESLEKIKVQNPNIKLIITVDNGIVANEAVNEANKLGIDVIITDHHQPGKMRPKAYSVIHTTKIGGAAIAWILAREVLKKLEIGNWKLEIRKSLELCAIGTISDQLPLIGPNRSFAKYGLEALNKTVRPGLLALFKEAGIKKGSAGWRTGTYEVNFVIAPRINAMGRLEHAIDSLRLLCTKSKEKATDLSYLLGKTNVKRQKIVEEVVAHAKGIAE
ncbi:DHH family phosphoesterase [Patescibacteria group bacterium]|nr:DHH family phosphoesterase [Patescibacteria group bacterium]